MALNASNVMVGVTGAAYNAPLGTTVPTDADTAVAAAFLDTGYIHEDGVTQSIETDVTDIKAWQNGDVVRKIQTQHDYTLNFKMIETTGQTLKLYYADPTATATAVKVTGAQSPHSAWVLEVRDGEKTVRIVLPDAQITERGEVTYKTDEAVAYDITITAYPDANGVKAYLYLDDGTSGE